MYVVKQYGRTADQRAVTKHIESEHTILICSTLIYTQCTINIEQHNYHRMIKRP